MLLEQNPGLKSGWQASGNAQDWTRLAAKHLIGPASSTGVPPVSRVSSRSKVQCQSTVSAMQQRFSKTVKGSFSLSS